MCVCVCVCVCASESVSIISSRFKHIKGSKERLFIRAKPHNLLINKRSFEPFMCLDLVLER